MITQKQKNWFDDTVMKIISNHKKSNYSANSCDDHDKLYSRLYILSNLYLEPNSDFIIDKEEKIFWESVNAKINLNSDDGVSWLSINIPEDENNSPTKVEFITSENKTQIKMFNGCFFTELEKPMQDWLAENPNIEVINTAMHSNIREDKYSDGGICNTYYECTIIIYYKNK